jgi:AcrR family transcriptional regulator
MPRLWDQTIEGHRSAVVEAIADKAAELAIAEGLTGLSMSRIAAEAGIGRATLYKYFSDVESILAVWHQRQVSAHLAQLAELRARAPSPLAGLEAILLAYAGQARQGHDHALSAALHAMPHMEHAHRALNEFVAVVAAEAVAAGELDAAASPGELARFALAAVSAGGRDATKSAVRRLVCMILRGMGAKV